MIRRLLLILAAATAASAVGAQTAPDLAKIRAAYQRLCTGDGAGGAEACAALRSEMEAAAKPAPAATPAVTPVADRGPSPNAANAMRLRSAFERLCTGAGSGSPEACAALRAEVDEAGTPGTVGWSGVVIGDTDDGTNAARILALLPGGPAARAGVRATDLVAAVDGQPTPNGAAFSKAIGGSFVGQRVILSLVRAEKIVDLPVKLTEQAPPNPKLNSQRTEKLDRSLWSGTTPAVDPMRSGEVLYGILEDSDASPDWGRRLDCIEIVDAGLGKNLVAALVPNGTQMRLAVLEGQCALVTPVTLAWTEEAGKKPVSVSFRTQPKARTFLMVSGASSSQPYQVIVREQSNKEYAAWQEGIRQQEIAAQERRMAAQRAAENRQAMFGAMVTGLAAGFAGVDVPMGGNTLENLNAINAVVQQKNVESAARLNATIAAAQAQAEEQRRDRERAEAEAERERQRRAAAAQRQQASGNGSGAGSGGAIVVSQSPAPSPPPAPPPASAPNPAPPPIAVASPAPSRSPSYPPRSCSTTTTMEPRTDAFLFMHGDPKTYQAAGRAEMMENVQRACDGGVMSTFNCTGGGAVGVFSCKVNFSCPVKQTKCTGGPPASKVSPQ